MTRLINHPLIWLFATFLCFPSQAILAADNADAKAQRKAAQTERQQLRKARNKENQRNVKEFRTFTKSLKKEYKERGRGLDADFKVQSLELKAERDLDITAAEKELQKSMTEMMFNYQNRDNQQTIEQLRANMEKHRDRVFAIRRESALAQHKQLIEYEKKKHQLYTEQDRKALDMARKLRLTEQREPIMASAKGGELTDQETRWNEKEVKQVEKLYASNRRLLSEFHYGEELRQWEIRNKQEDFELEWKKKEELHKLNNQQTYYSLLSTAFAGGKEQIDPKEISEQLAELNAQTKSINIRYNKIRDQNKVRRKEEKRDITGR